MAATRSPIHATAVDLPALTARGEAWDALAADALAPTPFYTRHVLATHAAHGLADGARALAVSRGDALLAVLPFGRRRIGWGRPVFCAWTSFITPASLPLLSAAEAEAAADGLLDAMKAAGSRPWLFPHLPLHAPAATVLLDAARRRGWPHAVLSSFDRPVLDLPGGLPAYEAALASTGRGRDLARRRRRLAEEGGARFSSAVAGSALPEGIALFLALEAAGWKGRRGTALASRPEVAAFARALFSPPDGPVSARADLLRAGDGRPLAASLALACGGTVYLLKSAYDQAAARAAPGILLEDEIVRAAAASGTALRLNSAATDPTPLDGLYPGRERLVDLLLLPSRSSGSGLAALVRAEQGRRAGTAAAKKAIRTMLRRITPR